MARRKVSRQKIKNAIPGSGGIISVIARRTDYTWRTVRDYIEADEELKAMLLEEEAIVDDIAESVLIQKIKEGDDMLARWWLARRRRHRYGDNLDLSGTGTVTIKVVREDEELASHGADV